MNTGDVEGGDTGGRHDQARLARVQAPPLQLLHETADQVALTRPCNKMAV